MNYGWRFMICTGDRNQDHSQEKEMGLNLWDYVLAVRTSEAKILLERTGLSIKDVAAKTGFTDPAYFTRVFHKEYGIAPTRIRVR